MTITAQNDTIRQALSPEIMARTRASLAQIYTAARHAESLVNQVMQMPLVQRAIERRLASAAARANSANPAAAAAFELLSLPSERWYAVFAALTPRQQKATLQRIIAAAGTFACTEPHRAHRLTGSVLRIVRHDRLPQRATLLRHQLAGRALLVRARALITLRAYDDALPVIADAHAAFPHQTTYARYRMHAQILRGQVLAATGHAPDALQILVACAQFAIDHIDPHALVDALASTAVVLCAHHEYTTARSAIALAAHVAGQPGNEEVLPTLHAGLAECAFLGYAPRHAPQPSP
jgi:hypothetical protein